MKWTGCGNSINTANPIVLKFIADSLRYWVEEMHVDGFRFDLATVLGRKGGEFTARSSFFDVLSQDPHLSRVKLIAEPWDMETYQAGNFPVDWCEWNGKFRDTVRRFVKGDGGMLGELGRRITGSADLFREDGRTGYHSVNFVTCHDGFTLHDLFSYNGKHNEANLEDNRDGSGENYSWNCGIEGETDDKEVLELRERLSKNALCLLFLSLGMPMSLGGDEVLRTQKGNNNAYCQDNEMTWFDWGLVKKNRGFLEFTKELIASLKVFEALQITKYFQEQPVTHVEFLKVDWFGCNLQPPPWGSFEERTLALQLHAREKGGLEYYIFLIMNGDWRSQRVQLPELPASFKWMRKIDTALPSGEDILPAGKLVQAAPQDHYQVKERSIVLLVGLHGGK